MKGCGVLHLPTYLRGLWQACLATGTDPIMLEAEFSSRLPPFAARHRCMLRGISSIVAATNGGGGNTVRLPRDLCEKGLWCLLSIVTSHSPTFSKSLLPTHAIPVVLHMDCCIDARWELLSHSISPRHLSCIIIPRVWIFFKPQACLLSVS